MKRVIAEKPSFLEFISELRLLLAKEIDVRWTPDKVKSSRYGRPLFLHFDEVGGLDHPALMKHLDCAEPRDVFYLFWATLDSIVKQPGCFVYVSGKDSSMDLVAHPGASRGKSSGYVERILLEPLSANHVIQMLSLPQPDDNNGLILCRAVFGIDESSLLTAESIEGRLLTELADLLVDITGGLPRALLYSFMWLKEHVGSSSLLKDFLGDRVKVR